MNLVNFPLKFFKLPEENPLNLTRKSSRTDNLSKSFQESQPRSRDGSISLISSDYLERSLSRRSSNMSNTSNEEFDHLSSTHLTRERLAKNSQRKLSSQLNRPTSRSSNLNLQRQASSELPSGPFPIYSTNSYLKTENHLTQLPTENSLRSRPSSPSQPSRLRVSRSPSQNLTSINAEFQIYNKHNPNNSSNNSLKSEILPNKNCQVVPSQPLSFRSSRSPSQTKTSKKEDGFNKVMESNQPQCSNLNLDNKSHQVRPAQPTQLRPSRSSSKTRGSKGEEFNQLLKSIETFDKDRLVVSPERNNERPSNHPDGNLIDLMKTQLLKMKLSNYSIYKFDLI